MNFTNLPSQLTAIFLGWIFTLWIQHRANVRAEAIRKKDKIIDRIDKMVEWVERSMPAHHERKGDSEEIYSAMVSQIEIRIGNLNSLLKSNLVPLESIAELRAVDILQEDKLEEVVKSLRIAAVSLTEELELACDSRYFKNRSINFRLKQYADEMHGAITGIAALIALFALFLLIEYFSR